MGAALLTAPVSAGCERVGASSSASTRATWSRQWTRSRTRSAITSWTSSWSWGGPHLRCAGRFHPGAAGPRRRPPRSDLDRVRQRAECRLCRGQLRTTTTGTPSSGRSTGPDEPDNDIARWDWTALPQAFAPGGPSRAHRAATAEQLAYALAAAGATQGLPLIQAVVPRMDVPDLLATLATAAAAANAAAPALPD